MPGRGGHYGGKWPAARAGFLQKHPWCAECSRLHQRTRATDVDHHVPWRQHPGGFWDTSNWRSLCLKHHRSKSGREAHGMTPIYGCDDAGMPLDPEHPWHHSS